jgi:hypothetical protein
MGCSVTEEEVVMEDDQLQGLSSVAAISENRGYEVGIAIYT